MNGDVPETIEEIESLVLTSKKEPISDPPVGKKKKKKARKDVILNFDLQYKNKPTGPSSQTAFFGEIDEPSSDLMSGTSNSEQTNGNNVAHEDIEYDTLLDNYFILQAQHANCEKEKRDLKAKLEAAHSDQVVKNGNFSTAKDNESDDGETDAIRDELVKLKNELKTTQRELQSTKTQLRETTTEAENLRKSNTTSSKKVEKDLERLKKETSQLQSDLKKKEDECARIACEKAAFFERMQALDLENKKLKQAIKHNNIELDASQERHRAICAEITVLTLQKNYETEIKLKVVNDIKKTIVHLDSAIEQVQGQDKIALQNYQNEILECMGQNEHELKLINDQIDNQIELVKSGLHLSSLQRTRASAPLMPPKIPEIKFAKKKISPPAPRAVEPVVSTSTATSSNQSSLTLDQIDQLGSQARLLFTTQAPGQQTLQPTANFEASLSSSNRARSEEPSTNINNLASVKPKTSPATTGTGSSSQQSFLQSPQPYAANLGTASLNRKRLPIIDPKTGRPIPFDYEYEPVETEAPQNTHQSGQNLLSSTSSTNVQSAVFVMPKTQPAVVAPQQQAYPPQTVPNVEKQSAFGQFIAHHFGVPLVPVQAGSNDNTMRAEYNRVQTSVPETPLASLQQQPAYAPPQRRFGGLPILRSGAGDGIGGSGGNSVVKAVPTGPPGLQDGSFKTLASAQAVGVPQSTQIQAQPSDVPVLKPESRILRVPPMPAAASVAPHPASSQVSPAPSQLGVVKKSKIDQIYDFFLNRYLGVSQEQIRLATQEYRDSQPDKKLSGKTMEMLKTGVDVILRQKYTPAQLYSRPTSANSFVSAQSTGSLAPNATAASMTPLGAARASAEQGGPHQQELNLECFICYEHKSSGECLMLDCGHEAHKECLEQWINENKTCPICRSLALPEDEFPRLG